MKTCDNSQENKITGYFSPTPQLYMPIAKFSELNHTKQLRTRQLGRTIWLLPSLVALSMFSYWLLEPWMHESNDSALASYADALERHCEKIKCAITKGF